MWKKLTLLEKIEKSRIKTSEMKRVFESTVSSSDKIISPIYMSQERVRVPDKFYSLNMNTYRNLNFIINNDLKAEYHTLMEDQLKWKVFKTPILIKYTLYYKLRCDLMNVISVVDKFFCDSLQHHKCISDDNIEYVTSYELAVWWKDKNNPRVEIDILEINN